jgi:hypothetical protein
MKWASSRGDFHLLRQIQQTQNKTGKQHRDMIQELIVPLFEDSNDAMIDYNKKSLFKVDQPTKDSPWGPIARTRS